MTSGVYLIRNVLTAKVYVGSSKNIEVRFYDHRWNLRRGSHSNRHLQSAWNLSGEDAFTFEVLIEVPAESLLDIEQEHMDALRAASREHGYNIDPRADRKVIAAETGRRISASNTGKKAGVLNPFYGKRHTAETKQKISERARGRKASAETLAKMSAAHLGELHWAYGKQYTDDEIARMSASMGHLKKPVGMYTKDGVLVKSYESVNATQADGFNPGYVGKACRGVTKVAHGHAWRFLSEEPKGLMKGAA